VVADRRDDGHPGRIGTERVSKFLRTDGHG
jgi:hypothetical protein